MPKASAKPKDDAAAQSARFIETARELGCDESPDAFEAAVKKVARHKPIVAGTEALEAIAEAGPTKGDLAKR